ncbi:KIP1-like protein [Cynara cardunculus var. scolymus]|uniref:KIP1-like protein n=1 Tax=Cynara cardunculus var. scolymus TaxID=59895 RepID=A0A103Y1F4_CYNCS|nr:KIP1-like protein [Cynara cardunculus var. scolymus]
MEGVESKITPEISTCLAENVEGFQKCVEEILKLIEWDADFFEITTQIYDHKNSKLTTQVTELSRMYTALADQDGHLIGEFSRNCPSGIEKQHLDASDSSSPQTFEDENTKLKSRMHENESIIEIASDMQSQLELAQDELITSPEQVSSVTACSYGDVVFDTEALDSIAALPGSVLHSSSGPSAKNSFQQQPFHKSHDRSSIGENKVLCEGNAHNVNLNSSGCTTGCQIQPLELLTNSESDSLHYTGQT